MKYVKVTEFTGRSSGDFECFCFDKRSLQEEIEFDEKKSLYMEDSHLFPYYENPYELDGFYSDVTFLYAEKDIWDEEDEARIYPHAILPEESNSYQPDTGFKKPMGKWKITVEFEPNE